MKAVLIVLLCLGLIGFAVACIPAEGVERIKDLEVQCFETAKAAAEKIRLLEEEIQVVIEKVKAGEMTIVEGEKAVTKITATITEIAGSVQKQAKLTQEEIKAIKDKYKADNWSIIGAGVLGIIELLTGLKLLKAKKFGTALVHGIQLLKRDNKVENDVVNTLMSNAGEAAGIKRKSFDYDVAAAKESYEKTAAAYDKNGKP